MADERVVSAVKISDAGTTSQTMGVDASGHAQVDIAASSVTVTVETELPAAAVLSDNFANPTAPGVAAFGMLWDGATWDRAPGNATDGVLVNLGDNNDVTVTSGSITADTELATAAALADNFANPTTAPVGAFGMLWDGATWDRAPGTAADGALVNLGGNNDVVVSGTVAVSGTVTVDSELPAAGALADGVSNPTVPGVAAFLMGWNSTTWDRVSLANGGRLQVDVVTGGGSNAPTNPTTNTATATDTAAGSSANLDSAEITEAEKLWQVVVSSSVAFKAVIQKVENGVATAVATLFGQAGTTVVWAPAHPNFVTHAGASAGLDVFRAVMSNLDTSEAADGYAAFEYAT